MTTSIGFGATYGAAGVSNAKTHDLANPQALVDGDDVHIAKADGLRGALGLYEVTIAGTTQFVTKEELEKIPSLARTAPGGAASAMVTSSTIKKENDTTSSTIKNMG